MNRATEVRPRLISPGARRRGFVGLAVSQFLGAFNDNAFKMLILVLATGSGRMSREALVGITGILISMARDCGSTCR